MHPSLSVIRGASRLGHLEKMSKIYPMSKLLVQILLIFSGVLNNYKNIPNILAQKSTSDNESEVLRNHDIYNILLFT